MNADQARDLAPVAEAVGKKILSTVRPDIARLATHAVTRSSSDHRCPSRR